MSDTQFLSDVYRAAVALLDARSVLDLTVDASVPDVAWQCQDAGMTAAEVAAQLVEDEAIR